MKKEDVLAKTAELLTAGWIAPFNEREFESFQEMTDEEKRIFVFIDGKGLPYKTMYKLYKKENNIVLARKTLLYKFMRNRFFTLSQYNTLFTATPKRVFVNDIASITPALRSLYGFDVRIHLKNSTEIRKFILKGELPKSWTSPNEKERIKLNFGPTELEVFTTNENAIIDRMIEDNDLLSLIRDMILQCKALNVKINAEWSHRRLHDQHQRWNSEMNKLRHRNCSTTPIWNIDNINIPDYMELINSEIRCAWEGDNMHHCLYNCYWSRIRNKQYMAFHVKSETGDFTVGIRINNNYEANLDQAYKAYNKYITEEDERVLSKVLKVAQSIVDRTILRNTLTINNDDEEFLWEA